MRVGVAVLALVALLLAPVIALAEPAWTVLTVYKDGYVKVEQAYAAAEEVQVKLLGKPEFLLVTDQEGLPLGYEQVSEGVIRVFCLNVSAVYVTYYTYDLTSKEGGLWTLSVSEELPNVTVLLPEGAVLLGFSPEPVSVSAEDETLVLDFASSPLKVEYTIPVLLETGKGEEKPAGQQPSGGATKPSGETGTQQPTTGGGAPTTGGGEEQPTTPPQETKPAKREEGGMPVWVYVLGGGAVAAAVTAFLLSRRRAESEEFLTEEEVEILRFVRMRGGQAYLTEIVEWLGLPKTTAWRRVKRMEGLGVVKLVRTPRGLLVQAA